MSDRFKSYSDGMLDIARKDNEELIKKHQRFIDLWNKELEEIDNEINERLKNNINSTINKLKDKGENSFV